MTALSRREKRAITPWLTRRRRKAAIRAEMRRADAERRAVTARLRDTERTT